MPQRLGLGFQISGAYVFLGDTKVYCIRLQGITSNMTYVGGIWKSVYRIPVSSFLGTPRGMVRERARAGWTSGIRQVHETRNGVVIEIPCMVTGIIQQIILVQFYHQKAHQPEKHWHRFSNAVACSINLSTCAGTVRDTSELKSRPKVGKISAVSRMNNTATNQSACSGHGCTRTERAHFGSHQPQLEYKISVKPLGM